MPTVKIYDIVTNDRYELPVKYHLVGAKAVAKFIGVTEGTVRKCLHYGRWGGEYKALEVGAVIIPDKAKKRKEKAYNRTNYLRHGERRRKYQREHYASRKAVQNG